MRNISGFNLKPFLLSVTCLLLIPSRGLAEKEPTATLNVQQKSYPVFDPEIFTEELPDPEPFFGDLRVDRAKFIAKQNKKKRGFFERLEGKDLTSEEIQQRIADFHQKQFKHLTKFQQKQQKKIDKYYDTQKKESHGNFFAELEEKRKAFLVDQNEKKSQFVKKLNKQDLPHDDFQEELQSFESKQNKQMVAYLQKQDIKKQKYQSKVNDE